MYCKKIFLAILCITLACTFIFSSPVASFAENELKNNNYSIKLYYDLKNRSATASQVVTYTNRTGNTLNDICFSLYPNTYSKSNKGYAKAGRRPEEFGNMEINSVSINDESCKFKVDGINLQVNTNEPLSPDKTISIHISYKIKLPEPGGRYGYCNGTSSFVYWYPMLEVYENNAWQTRKYSSVGELNFSEVADYEVEITLPEAENIASTGVITKDEKLGDGFKRITMEALDVRDFTWICSSNFCVKTENCDGIKINNYFSKEYEKEAANAGKYAADAIKYFNEVIGRYPYKEFSVVLWPKDISQGIEHTGIIHIGLALYKNEKALKETIVHEVAHQYFYSLIGNDECDEPWLDESFATYYTARFLNEELDDPKKVIDILKAIRPDITDKPVLSSSDELGEDGYAYTVYTKGAYILSNFSKIIGQDKFDNIIKTYYERYKFHTTHTSYFLDIVSEIAGKEQASMLLNALTDYSYKPQADAYSEMYSKVKDGQEGFLMYNQNPMCLSKPLVKKLAELKKALPLIPQVNFSYFPYKSKIAVTGRAYPLYSDADIKKNAGKVRNINYDAKSISYQISYNYTPGSIVKGNTNLYTSIDIYPKAIYEKSKGYMFGKIEKDEKIVSAGYNCSLMTVQAMNAADSKETASQKYLGVNIKYKGNEFVLVIALPGSIEKADLNKILKGISII